MLAELVSRRWFSTDHQFAGLWIDVPGIGFGSWLDSSIQVMPEVEILGVERQYVGGSVKALVPMVVGQTEQARLSKRAATSTRKATRDEVLAACPDDAARFFDELLDDAAS